VPDGGRLRFETVGFNYRLTEMQGALGRAQMARLPALVERRAALVRQYEARLAGVPRVHRPRCTPGAAPVWQSYVLRLDDAVDRDRVLARLRADGIEATLGTYALSAQPAWAGRVASCPRSQRAFRSTVSLPLHAGLSDGDVAAVAEALARAVAADGA
jgi:perosamine synthetase